MKTEFTAQVEEFRVKLGLPVSNVPQLLEPNDASFYARFVMEEMSEFLLAHEKGDLVGAADALGDLIYLLTGCSLMMGLPIDEILGFIHTANMDKVKGVSKRNVADAVKLPGWRGPESAIQMAIDAKRMGYAE